MEPADNCNRVTGECQVTVAADVVMSDKENFFPQRLLPGFAEQEWVGVPENN